jgi:hypothetical protein
MGHGVKVAMLVVVLCGCGADLVADEGFSIRCGDAACDWVTVEGTADFAPSWHDGDPGLDLSRPGRVVVEQRSGPIAIASRELVLRAAVARDPQATLELELDWYVAGAGSGATYWDRQPVLVGRRGIAVGASGVFAIDEQVSTPTPEVSGLVLRIVKDGEGRAIIDEISLREPIAEVSR